MTQLTWSSEKNVLSIIVTVIVFIIFILSFINFIITTFIFHFMLQ